MNRKLYTLMMLMLYAFLPMLRITVYTKLNCIPNTIKFCEGSIPSAKIVNISFFIVPCSVFKSWSGFMLVLTALKLRLPRLFSCNRLSNIDAEFHGL